MLSGCCKGSGKKSRRLRGHTGKSTVQCRKRAVQETPGWDSCKGCALHKGPGHIGERAGIQLHPTQRSLG